jgi:integrase
MFAFAAYTGARRSEILRSQVDDFDFEGNDTAQDAIE